MRVNRIHVPGPIVAGTEITLPRQAGEHLTRVLRLDAGAPFTVFDGRGGEFAAELSTVGKEIRARVLSHEAVERESPLRITLLQGVARGERMDLIVQKATELGVARIVPVLTVRSVVKLDARQSARKLEHWQAVVVAACEQCGRNRIPEVAAPAPLGDALPALPPGESRCLLAADAEPSLTRAVEGNGSVVLLIGPEGGLADDERKFARACGFESYRIGPRILRTETAGLAAIATLQAAAGDFA